MYLNNLPWWLTLPCALLLVGGLLSSNAAWHRLSEETKEEDEHSKNPSRLELSTPALAGALETPRSSGGPVGALSWIGGRGVTDHHNLRVSPHELDAAAFDDHTAENRAIYNRIATPYFNNQVQQMVSSLRLLELPKPRRVPTRYR